MPRKKKAQLLFTFPGVVEILRDDPGYILVIFKKRKRDPLPGKKASGEYIRKQYYCATLAQAFSAYIDRKPDPDKPSVKTAKEVLEAIQMAVEDVRKMAAALCPVMQEEARRTKRKEKSDGAVPTPS